MVEENKETKTEEKVNMKEKNVVDTTKKEEKIVKKEKNKQEIAKKEKAEARGKDLDISTKQAVAICNFIRGKRIERAMINLEEVIKLKKAVKMKGEIPHRKGIGGAGRYPVKAAKIFNKLLKSLSANSSVGGIENPYITTAKADMASRPYKRTGQMRFKRTHVYLEAREIKAKNKKQEERK